MLVFPLCPRCAIFSTKRYDMEMFIGMLLIAAGCFVVGTAIMGGLIYLIVSDFE